jgi:hypothetical protein
LGPHGHPVHGTREPSQWGLTSILARKTLLVVVVPTNPTPHPPPLPTRITVICKDGGLKLLQIQDNGSGIGVREGTYLWRVPAERVLVGGVQYSALGGTFPPLLSHPRTLAYVHWHTEGGHDAGV